MGELCSSGRIADLLGAPRHHLIRTITRGYYPEPQRVAGGRVFRADEVPAIAEAMRRAGFLRSAPAPGGHAGAAYRLSGNKRQVTRDSVIQVAE